MRVLDWIARLVAWVATLSLCGGVFAASLYALTGVVGDASPQGSTTQSRFSTTLVAPPVLEPGAFDVRKVAAFVTEPRTGKAESLPDPQAAQEELRSAAMPPAATPAKLTPSDDATFGATEVVTTAVNLRAGPSKAAARLATLEAGEGLRVLGRSGSWVQVLTGTGETGWVYGRYLGGAAPTEVLTAVDVKPPSEWEIERRVETEGSMVSFEPEAFEAADEAGSAVFFVERRRPRLQASIDSSPSSSGDSSADDRDTGSGTDR